MAKPITPNLRPEGGFAYAATTKNVTGQVNLMAMNQRNAAKNKKPKRNYFTKQVQKFGDQWIAKKSDQDLENGVKDVLRDLVKGNLTNEDFNYFYNQKFSAAIRQATFDKMNHYRVLATAAEEMQHSYALKQIPIPQQDNEILEQQKVLYHAYTDLQVALCEFARLSPDSNAAITYMATFQMTMRDKYKYAARCF